ncbi:hypothetical protein [Epilithonimonas xixisoli]|uniref:Uncharacterized protein n=1 Tax=Epilithonimonas xixisoli TaxID=1476462 RepID=A0A4R8I512_9FLAO|nr:hypothetical protein [Epilithonimonas xixisoli]TDX83977.1 hypothetical protein B0I22_1565 [Epilithonimonas xixisoli]
MTDMRSYWSVKRLSPNSVNGSKSTQRRKKVKLARKENLKNRK